MKSNHSIKKYILLVGVLFLFPLSLILIFGVFGEHKFNTLPYFGQHTVDPVSGDSLYFTLPQFAFTNQENQTYTLDSLKGKVWMASFYSTNSPHIRKITARLLWPNWRYRGESDIAIVSFTLDPEHDTPKVLKDYVEQMTAYNDFDGKWQFLTGERDTLFNYLNSAFELNDPELNAFMYLIDTEGHIRGRYNANFEEQIKDAIEDIALLKKELDIRAYEERKQTEAGTQNE
jgi:protein SCO1/2